MSEEMNAQNGSGIPSEDLVKLNVPYFDASSVVVHGAGNTFLLLFQRPMPVQPRLDTKTQLMIYEPVAAISFSPQTIKDLTLILQDVVADHEKEYGKIETPYTKKREAAGNEK